jgi:hypothetical protein
VQPTLGTEEHAIGRQADNRQYIYIYVNICACSWLSRTLYDNTYSAKDNDERGGD